jgi:threonine/homoserine/homoserine lactone efflux protein
VRDWLVPALGVAFSPLPLLGMLLLLGGARATAQGPTFWAAWTVGVAAPTLAFVALAEEVGAIEEDPSALAAAQVVVGVLLLALAARIAVGGGRTRGGATPRWLLALDGSGPGRAAALALALSALNPKNLALMLAAAVAIAHANEGGGELAAASLAFVLVAVSTISALLAAHAVLPRRTARPLAVVRAFVAGNDRVLAVVLGLLVGGFFVVDGLRVL